MNTKIIEVSGKIEGFIKTAMASIKADPNNKNINYIGAAAALLDIAEKEQEKFDDQILYDLVFIAVAIIFVTNKGQINELTTEKKHQTYVHNNERN